MEILEGSVELAGELLQTVFVAVLLKKNPQKFCYVCVAVPMQ